MTTHDPSAPARHAVRKTSTILSDGRELLYFDDSEPYVSGELTRDLVDTRPLPTSESLSQMRFDVLTGDWVVIAAQRMDRTFLPPPDESPLAPSRPGHPPTEIPASDYDVVVFENRFPSLAQSAAAQHLPSSVDGEELWPLAAGTGRCEVVCFASDPDASFASLDPHRVRTIVDVWADRTEALSALPGVRQVFCFENRGKEIGVTLTHPHGQIYAYPYLPPRTDAMMRQSKLHAERTGRKLLTDVLDAELRSGRRIVVDTEHWVAYVPAASRWPLEIHLAPRRDVPDLAALTVAERDSLAHVYRDLLRSVDNFFDGVDEVPYIAAWHQAPVGEDRDLGRLHLQLFSMMRSPGRMKFLAGSESAMGAWINDTTPEKIADRLREVHP
ncbi:galactose-1-phosphate uridylyltransferase [Rhodococcus sp. Leaf7]|uniref:galactose-1-phosphate uridylyltransferase n=1 Tax=unclassified Rhodococcus (in: high G+C Gram-positive bacteria) TaxID=192944 RepID=UPI0006F94148|nr:MULTISPECIES: galactose-1-phosphate uridylyltransferase [unclassified Rhodococcus (in: high G+C Gram-positive bacteria)]KQU07236.1 galactose-1-phosphate uridylyltransferase [Rhodococcus sp. Leaf7]KQU42754.1 galactose-1-phosphate uridylyltransferase [Rhodococcus sp. Leaf247]